MIGGAIFLVPATIAAQIGNWGPIGFVLGGIAGLLVALCFAEAGSRFDNTGGAYIYSRTAFGRLFGFEVGWLQWFTRVASQATIVNGVALALGFYWPALKSGWPRAVLVAGITILIGYAHVRGIRQSAWVVNSFTIAKLVPLAVFVVGGLCLMDWRGFGNQLVTLPPVNWQQAATAGLLLMFAFGGFDTLTVPAGESRNPRADVPFALIWTLLISMLVMCSVQVVTMATLSGLASSTTPVADAAGRFAGPVGAAMIGIGSVISMIGNNAGSSLAGPRILFALGENGDLPEVFARIHLRYRTPSNAIWFSTAVTTGLALSGSFAALAEVSTIARLLTYTGVSLATLALRRPRFIGRVHAAAFVIPLGATLPVLALAVSLAILAGISWGQMLAGGVALGCGAVLFFWNDARERRKFVVARAQAGGA